MYLRKIVLNFNFYLHLLIISTFKCITATLYCCKLEMHYQNTQFTKFYNLGIMCPWNPCTCKMYLRELFLFLKLNFRNVSKRSSLAEIKSHNGKMKQCMTVWWTMYDCCSNFKSRRSVSDLKRHTGVIKEEYA